MTIFDAIKDKKSPLVPLSKGGNDALPFDKGEFGNLVVEM